MNMDGRDSQTMGTFARRTSGLLLAVAFLFACGGADDSDTIGADTASAETDTRGQQAGQRAATSARADTVEVSLTEFEIDMRGSVQAGPIAFRVTNDGSAQHSFEVEGQGVEEAFETNLRPGQSRTLTVDLQPGTYEIYCPVQDHADRGMRLQLEVTR